MTSRMLRSRRTGPKSRPTASTLGRRTTFDLPLSQTIPAVLETTGQQTTLESSLSQTIQAVLETTGQQTMLESSLSQTIQAVLETTGQQTTITVAPASPSRPNGQSTQRSFKHFSVVFNLNADCEPNTGGCGSNTGCCGSIPPDSPSTRLVPPTLETIGRQTILNPGISLAIPAATDTSPDSRRWCATCKQILKKEAFPKGKTKCKSCTYQVRCENRLKKKEAAKGPILCGRCNKLTEISDWDFPQNRCKACFVLYKRELHCRKKEKANGIKWCGGCNQFKKFSDFSDAMSKCKPCYARVRRERRHKQKKEAANASTPPVPEQVVAEKQREQDVIPQEAPVDHKWCCMCNAYKRTIAFASRSNSCQSCFDLIQRETPRACTTCNVAKLQKYFPRDEGGCGRLSICDSCHVKKNMTVEKIKAARAVPLLRPPIRKGNEKVHSFRRTPEMFDYGTIDSIYKDSKFKPQSAVDISWQYIAKVYEPGFVKVVERFGATKLGGPKDFQMFCWEPPEELPPCWYRYKAEKLQNQLYIYIDGSLLHPDLDQKQIAGYRLAFLLNVLQIDPKLVTSGVILSVDHLCHNCNCLNPDHLDVTYTRVNGSRNGCGPLDCGHDRFGLGKKCVIVGHEASGTVPFPGGLGSKFYENDEATLDTSIDIADEFQGASTTGRVTPFETATGHMKPIEQPIEQLQYRWQDIVAHSATALGMTPEEYLKSFLAADGTAVVATDSGSNDRNSHDVSDDRKPAAVGAKRKFDDVDVDEIVPFEV